MFNDFASNCDGLTNCVYINDFITANNFVDRQFFVHNILKWTIKVFCYLLCTLILVNVHSQTLPQDEGLQVAIW